MSKRIKHLKEGIELLNNIMIENNKVQENIDILYKNLKNELDTIKIVLKEIKEDRSKFTKDKSINRIDRDNRTIKEVEQAKEIELDDLEKELDNYELNHKRLKENSFEMKRR